MGNLIFFTDQIKLTDRECLVDVGAYDGDTIRSFEKVTSNQYEKIYAFEMDRENYTKLQTNAKIRGVYWFRLQDEFISDGSVRL